MHFKNKYLFTAIVSIFFLIAGCGKSIPEHNKLQKPRLVIATDIGG